MEFSIYGFPVQKQSHGFFKKTEMCHGNLSVSPSTFWWEEISLVLSGFPGLVLVDVEHHFFTFFLPHLGAQSWLTFPSSQPFKSMGTEPCLSKPLYGLGKSLKSVGSFGEALSCRADISMSSPLTWLPLLS